MTHTHPIGLLWTSDQLVEEAALRTQHTTNTIEEHPCPQQIRTSIPSNRATAARLRSNFIENRNELIFRIQSNVSCAIFGAAQQHFICDCDSFCVVLVSSEDFESWRGSLCPSDSRLNKMLLNRHFKIFSIFYWYVKGSVFFSCIFCNIFVFFQLDS
jgi:hypothetical protein